MQTSNLIQFTTKEELDRIESSINEQLERKAIIQQRITAYLNLRDTDKKYL
jgi:hypothetical protein